MKTVFINAQQAFEYYYKTLSNLGYYNGKTKSLINVGFTITQPWQRSIRTHWRNWNSEYAEAEWKWYVSGNPSLSQLKRIYGKVPKIWKKHANQDGDVMSNYGWQINRKAQWDKVRQKLINNPSTRRAVLSIYDAKEIDIYHYDTPCTIAIHFQILEGRLEMTVMMRSCDLWYGFCNDQYCFSKLQSTMAREVGVVVGNYHHFVSNFHLYEQQFNKNGN